MVDMALVAGIIQLAPSQGQDLLDGNPWAVLIHTCRHQFNAHFVLETQHAYRTSTISEISARNAT
jgi:tryptophanase